LGTSAWSNPRAAATIHWLGLRRDSRSRSVANISPGAAHGALPCHRVRAGSWAASLLRRPPTPGRALSPEAGMASPTGCHTARPAALGRSLLAPRIAELRDHVHPDAHHLRPPLHPTEDAGRQRGEAQVLDLGRHREAHRRASASSWNCCATDCFGSGSPKSGLTAWMTPPQWSFPHRGGVPRSCHLCARTNSRPQR
jgi:hypothetical protein